MLVFSRFLGVPVPHSRRILRPFVIYLRNLSRHNSCRFWSPKTSLSLTREAHFRGSRGLKTTPKSSGDPPGTPSEAPRKFHAFFLPFFDAFGPFWASRKGPKIGPEGVKNLFKNQLKKTLKNHEKWVLRSTECIVQKSSFWELLGSKIEPKSRFH